MIFEKYFSLHTSVGEPCLHGLTKNRNVCGSSRHREPSLNWNKCFNYMTFSLFGEKPRCLYDVTVCCNICNVLLPNNGVVRGPCSCHWGASIAMLRYLPLLIFRHTNADGYFIGIFSLVTSLFWFYQGYVLR